MAETSYSQYAPYAIGAGSGAQAFASLAQGLLAAKRARVFADYNSAVTLENARAAEQAMLLEALQQERAAAIAEQDMQLVEQAGAYREARMREQHAALLGETRAILAASGVLMSGSPLRVYEETARQQERDVLMSQYQTKLQQRALREEAAQQRYGATLSRYGAAERLRIGRQQAGLIRATADTSGLAAGLFGAGSSLLEGAGATLYARERAKPSGPTLGTTPSFGYRYTPMTAPQRPYVLWNQ